MPKDVPWHFHFIHESMKGKENKKNRVFIFGGEDFYEAQRKALAFIEQCKKENPSIELVSLDDNKESTSDSIAVLGQLKEEILTPPLFDELKLIFWKNARFLAAGGLGEKKIEQGVEEILRILKENPPENLIVVILAESIDKRKKLFQELKSLFKVELTTKLDPLDSSSVMEVMEKLEENGIEADLNVALQLLIESGSQRSLLDMEIEKLSLYLGAKGRIEEKALTDLFCGRRETVIWRFCDLVMGAKFDLAFVELRSLLQEGGSEIGIILSLSQRIFWACLGLILIKKGLLQFQGKGKYLKLNITEEAEFVYPKKKSGERINPWVFGHNLEQAQGLGLNFWLWAFQQAYETHKKLISASLTTEHKAKVLERLVVKMKRYAEDFNPNTIAKG
ncbi:DNA polymerase III subunit delta [Methylacidiphilum caldifontis]|uniref:DNA polymerase III subunit delta n=1 Tax=Methylacidiphilum caldifontis TaxID=2795386 RepID=UPI001F5E1309|nr:DNA polymerase III subunit delta [Methylacidiphilum caldifontis]